MNKNKKNKRKKKNKQRVNRLVLWPLIILIGGFLAGTYLYSNYTEEAKLVKEYFNLLNEKKYEEIYDLVETDMSKEEFIERVKNIYDGIEANNISVRIVSNTTTQSNDNKKTEENQDVNVSYKLSMKTIAGDINISNSVPIMKNNNEYKIKWNSSMIFNNLNNDEKVRIKSLQGKRGKIYDRNGYALAKDSSIYEIGIIPGKLAQKSDINKIADLLEISSSSINQKLNNNYITDESFIPLKRISKEEQQLKNDLLKIKGIIVDDKDARVYPYKEATSIMIGYTQDGEGKAGLELSFNDRLKGKNGAEIYIENKDGRIKEILARKEASDGEDIKLTIDANLQKKLYDEFKEDSGTIVSLNYNTGEVLALVSTPSYDANKFSLGITDEEWNAIQNNEKHPMFNRYLATYTPGSTFKPIIGAIGLKNNSFTEEDDFGSSGKKWQKDSSWKDFYITTLEQYTEPANLENALIYSDNIYFAKAALKIGSNNLERGLNDFGFNSKIDFEQEIEKSTYGSFDNEKTIANAGFGQASIMINPILMASIYSAFANGGNMIKPYIQFEENEENKTKYYKENVITQEIANTIKNYLIEVVEKGTAKKCYIEGRKIAGKTGTAEIKKDQKDKNGTENGWFNSFDEYGKLYVCMVEDVKNKEGSKYVVEKMRNIYDEMQN